MYNMQSVFQHLNLMAGFSKVFEGFLNWYFNVTLITDQKIVDIDFEYLLYKAVNLAPLSKIEETFNGEEWIKAINILKNVKNLTSLENISKKYLDI